MTVTWPKENGVFKTNGKFESAAINAPRFVDGVRVHFTRYVAALRAGSDLQLCANFQAVVDLKWMLNEPAPVIGMCEDDFFSR